MRPENPPPFWSRASTLILAAVIVGIAILMAAVIVAMVATARPARPITPPEVTRQVAVVTVLPGATAAPLPTYTPPATYTPFPTPTAPPTATPTPTPVPAPLPDWRGLGELTAIEYTASTVVQRERTQAPIGNLILGKDRIVLNAVGKVRLGVEMSKIRLSDVVREGNKISLRLPAIAVLSVEMLPELSRVYDSQATWLFSQYRGLELEAMDSAKRLLFYEAANNQEMLKIAESMARLQLRDFLLKAGFEEVAITFAD
jgi:hypothetical protein